MTKSIGRFISLVLLLSCTDNKPNILQFQFMYVAFLLAILILWKRMAALTLVIIYPTTNAYNHL
jgi:hypothetical protein